MLRKEVNLYIECVRFHKVSILVFKKSLSVFQRGFGVLSLSWELKKAERHFSTCSRARSARPPAGPGDGDARILASARVDAMLQFPSLRRGVGLPFLHPSLHSWEGWPGPRAKGLCHGR